MKSEQINHMESLIRKTTANIGRKYRAGAKKHNNTLLTMSPAKLLDNAIDEAIDQVCYLETLKEKLYPNDKL